MSNTGQFADWQLAEKTAHEIFELLRRNRVSPESSLLAVAAAARELASPRITKNERTREAALKLSRMLADLALDLVGPAAEKTVN